MVVKGIWNGMGEKHNPICPTLFLASNDERPAFDFTLAR
jgi:hypothetical protein